MVHIVRKKIKDRIYLYLQRSINEHGKRRTEHVAYLGAENALLCLKCGRRFSKINKSCPKCNSIKIVDAYSPSRLKQIINMYNHPSKVTKI